MAVVVSRRYPQVPVALQADFGTGRGGIGRFIGAGRRSWRGLRCSSHTGVLVSPSAERPAACFDGWSESVGDGPTPVGTNVALKAEKQHERRAEHGEAGGCATLRDAVLEAHSARGDQRGITQARGLLKAMLGEADRLSIQRFSDALMKENRVHPRPGDRPRGCLLGIVVQSDLGRRIQPRTGPAHAGDVDREWHEEILRRPCAGGYKGVSVSILVSQVSGGNILANAARADRRRDANSMRHYADASHRRLALVRCPPPWFAEV